MGTLRPISPVLKSPFVVCMWIVDHCNLNCRYCYAMPFKGGMMETGRMLSLIDELVELEVFDITMAGGEPFLHPAIFDGIDRLLSSGTNLGVLSNGTLFDAAMTSRLVDTIKGRNNFLLQISLDSIDPAIHDKTRGGGALILDNLDRICRETDIRLQLATVLNSHNIDSAKRIIEKYYPRVKRFHFMNLQRTARSLHYNDLFVSEERNTRFWEDLERYMQEMPRDILITSLNIMRLVHRMQDNPAASRCHSTFNCASCTAGITHVEITSAFDILGCDIAKDFTPLGNVAHQSFSDVWHSDQAERVRQFPFPACYLVQDPEGKSLADNLPPEIANYRASLCTASGTSGRA